MMALFTSCKSRRRLIIAVAIILVCRVIYDIHWNRTKWLDETDIFGDEPLTTLSFVITDPDYDTLTIRSEELINECRDIIMKYDFQKYRGKRIPGYVKFGNGVGYIELRFNYQSTLLLSGSDYISIRSHHASIVPEEKVTDLRADIEAFIDRVYAQEQQ